MKNLTKRIPAFTLTELLVVLVIIGILVLLALPKLMPYTKKNIAPLDPIGFRISL